jgi:hypothetical protein
MNCIKNLLSILINIPYRQETMGGTIRQQEHRCFKRHIDVGLVMN